MKPLLALFLSISCAAVLGAKRPNILLIDADDLGYGDVSCYNPDRGKIATPHTPIAVNEAWKGKSGISPYADVLDAKLPENAGEDSFSLLPLLGGVDQPVRGQAVNCSASGVPALRQGPWKLIFGTPGQGMARDKDKPGEPAIHLYNLADDLGETKNLAAAQPEKVAEMKDLMEKLITDGRSTLGPKQRNDVKVVRHPGKP